MSLLNEMLAKPIEMEFLRRDALGGERHSMGHLVFFTDCYPDRVVQFGFRDVNDPILSSLKGKGEFFEDQDGRFPRYLHLHGLSVEFGIHFDMVVYPLKMERSIGLHLHGNYGYQSVRHLNLHNVPEPVNIHELKEGPTLAELKTKMDGGSGADDGSTVIGSSWVA